MKGNRVVLRQINLGYMLKEYCKGKVFESGGLKASEPSDSQFLLFLFSSRSKSVITKSTLKRKSQAEQLDAAEVEIVEVVVQAAVLEETRAALPEVPDKLAEEARGHHVQLTAVGLEPVVGPQTQGLDLAVDLAAVGTVEVAAENTSSLCGESKEE